MSATLKLYCDWVNKKLVLSSKSSSPFALPNLNYGDVVPFRITLLEPNPTAGVSAYAVTNLSNVALKFIIASTATSTATTLVTQYTWSKNTNDQYFYADVAFNTAELSTWIGSDLTKTAYLELQMTEGSSVVTIYKSAVTVVKGILTPATLSVPPGETALSLESANAIFAKQVMAAGQTVTLASPDGTKGTILRTNDDGTFEAMPVNL